jgi:hypothetical protein
MSFDLDARPKNETQLPASSATFNHPSPNKLAKVAEVAKVATGRKLKTSTPATIVSCLAREMS